MALARKGVVAAISQFLIAHHGSVLHSDDHLDNGRDLFLSRLEWDLDGFDIPISCGSENCGVLYSVNIGARPFVSMVQPIGKAGTPVGILGQGFTGATKVAFNKMPASFSVVSDTYLTATAPAGVTTGYVTVKTPSGTLKSNKKFQVLP